MPKTQKITKESNNKVHFVHRGQELTWYFIGVYIINILSLVSNFFMTCSTRRLDRLINHKNARALLDYKQSLFFLSPSSETRETRK